ncbi:alpha-tectorin-like, partial [Saccoglossus kowalevskii]|uniref:Zonadhesin-like n=1 Tax=Saccoglossus kowalevskii TaxID=10224 RepID=A0ABM0MR82_SACKO
RFETDFGMDIFWDGYDYLEVHLSTDYRNTTCGFAGNYDFIANNDLKTPNGDMAANVEEFGDSWVYNTDTCDTIAEVVDPCVNRTESEMTVIKNACSIIYDVEGPFRDCFRHVNYAGINDTCVYDYCATYDDISSVCENIEVLSHRCNQRGATIYPWRSESFCPINCTANSEYTMCANLCGPTCADPDGQCRPTCYEGCDCLDGFVRDGMHCIPVQECGCIKDGYSYMVGDQFIDDVCNQQCTCNATNNMVCSPIFCDTNATCDVRGGLRGCFCDEGYTGNGFSCTEGRSILH